MKVMRGIAEDMNGGGGLGVSVALVWKTRPAESVVSNAGQVLVVSSVTPGVIVLSPDDCPTTIVEIHQTEVVIGGLVIVVVYPELVTVTSGYAVVVVTPWNGGSTTVHGN